MARAPPATVGAVDSPPVPGLLLRDHHTEVPLDHADPGGPTISVYAREVRAVERAADDLPWLVFLQGGPGGKAGLSNALLATATFTRHSCRRFDVVVICPTGKTRRDHRWTRRPKRSGQRSSLTDKPRCNVSGQLAPDSCHHLLPSTTVSVLARDLSLAQ